MMNCSDTPLEDYWEYQLSQNIYKYGGIILLVIGIIGNVLSMIVLLRKKFRTTTTGVYLFALSVTDCTVIIWAQFLRHALRGLTGIDLPNQYPWFCKLWYFIIKVTTTASGWLLAALTIERVLGIYMPLKWRIYSTTQNARIGIIAIYISLAGINMHYFWSYGPVYITDEKNITTKATGCSISTDDSNLEHFMLNYRPTMDLITRTFLPFAVIAIGNIMIIFKLKKQLRTRDHLTQSKNEFQKIDKYGAENPEARLPAFQTNALTTRPTRRPQGLSANGSSPDLNWSYPPDIAKPRERIAHADDSGLNHA
ncbi:unnamed protein product [Owenia fusiformis]|uniref:G-protein coupled receptors family 1 profile domain-containing protein n=1 Tax=Owenia fusiformis TaxID=6347 RepID=A0A8S4NGL6_OWEFU|nr:unnamed protein product [Owenia fusiformis]